MNSGLQHLQVSDPVFGGTFPAIAQYPTPVPPAGVAIGPFTWSATLDAPLASGSFPVCVISHGAGGSHLLYRTIATHLACAGWIVVCPEHPRDNRNDRSLAYSDVSVSNRCPHLTATLDALFGNARLGPGCDRGRVGLVGHSMGGCAALALAGGQPWSRARTPIPVQPDLRFRAAVLMAPALAYFRGPGALDRISIPLLVFAGEKDEVTPAQQAEEILRTMPPSAKWDLIVVSGAGHYSFLSPFPEALRRPDFPPGEDPAGFNRDKFHAELPGLVESFLARSLPPG